MASGKTHDWVTHVMVVPTIVVAYTVFNCTFDQSLLVALGMWVGGIFLSPDLDIKSTPFYRWGPLRFIWWPYQWAIKHRSSASHGLFFAPFFRLAYLSAMCVLIYYGAVFILHQRGWIPPDMGQTRRATLLFLEHHVSEMILLMIGVWLGSFFHVVLDTLSSGLKFRFLKR